MSFDDPKTFGPLVGAYYDNALKSSQKYIKYMILGSLLAGTMRSDVGSLNYTTDTQQSPSLYQECKKTLHNIVIEFQRGFPRR